VELQRAVTIAIRYACIRRQFKQRGISDPVKLMDYQTHQYRLLPLLAGCYAMLFSSRKLCSSYQHVILDNLKQKKVLSVELADLHNTSAGLKAFTTWLTTDGIEQCRQACGGHGYSAYSGLGPLFNDFVVNCTWEGDNTVLTQQVSNYLIKSIQKVIKNGNKPCLGGASVQYLNNYTTILASKCRAQSVDDFFNEQIQLEAYQYRAAKTVLNAGTRILQEFQKYGKGNFQAFNACQVDLMRSAKAHTYLYMVNNFIQVVQDPSNANPIPGVLSTAPISPEVQAALKKTSDLFALYHLEADMSVFLTEGYMTAEQAKMVSAAVRKIMQEVRQDAIALVDAFNLSDFIVNSPLGSYDGNIYQKYFDRVKKTSYGQKRASYYEQLIKPAINPNAGFA
jgi:acyl-CoA oxidase